MPLVTVQMYEGRTVEQKKALVEEITKAVVKTTGTTEDHVWVIINDVPKTNWGRKGKLASESP